MVEVFEIKSRVSSDAQVALKFAQRVKGWRSYSDDDATVNAINFLLGYGLIDVNEFNQFRIREISEEFEKSPMPPVSDYTRRDWFYNSGQVYSGSTVVARAERDANLARNIPPVQRDENMKLIARTPRMYEILRQIIIDFEANGKVEQIRIDQAKGAIDIRRSFVEIED